MNKLDKENEYAKSLVENNIALKYTTAPDEEFVTDVDAIKEIIDKYIQTADNDQVISFASKHGLYTLPFYNLFNQKVEQLPVVLITNSCGSNGMCAGNNPKEAIIQGIGEIVERYVMRLIYRDNITPPSVPKDEFIGNEIYDRIISLEKLNDITIDIKDCSCGIGIPAIGVLITENKSKRYQFRLGVDPSPITALERCLTELFQGREDLLFFDMDIPYQVKLLSDVDIKEQEFKKSFMTGTGHYPVSLFYSQPSYPFAGFDSKLAKSDEYDLKYVLETIKGLGFNVYIRDTTFLGFPSFRVFIPGMSELNNTFTNSYFSHTYMNREGVGIFKTAHNPSNASVNDIAKLMDYIDERGETGSIPAIDNIVNKNVWNTMNRYFVASILGFRNGLIERAIKMMEVAISQSSDEYIVSFCKCCAALMATRDDATIEVIKRLYDSDTCELASAILFAETGLAYLKFATCFNCNQCKIKSTCQYIEYAKLLKRIECEYENNIPNQEAVATILGM
ncbi:MAG: YcaO-like family protein [Rikenellaceae bacterium]